MANAGGVMSGEKLVVDSKVVITITVDDATGAMEFKCDKEGVPAMVFRSWLNTLSDRMLITEIMGQSEARFMARIGGKRKKGIIQ